MNAKNFLAFPEQRFLTCVFSIPDKKSMDMKGILPWTFHMENNVGLS